MSFFIKHAKVNRSGVTIMMAFQLGLFLMGVVMVLCINAFFNDEQNYALVGGLMALLATVFGGLARGGGALNRYRMAVSMGQTRRAYMIFDPILTVLTSVIGIMFAWVLNHLELWLYQMIYPGWTLDINFFEVFQWWHGVLFVIGVALGDFLFGALMLRFGTKGFAAIWFPLCFAPMIIMNSTEAVKEGSTSLLAQIGRGVLFLVNLLSQVMWAAVGLALLLVLLALSVMCYRKAEVRM